ncbi:MAG: terpene cyclase/mutase family protein [Planctomycetota bacterium]|nr:terpene cyclase/mutase family protein [Planctomycetota bacterium]
MPAIRCFLSGVVLGLVLYPGVAKLRAAEESNKPEPAAETPSNPTTQKSEDSSAAKKSELAISAALNWLARHQLPDGRWSLSKYQTVCKDPPCSGPGAQSTDTAATAFGLLPFLAAGQTHKSQGPYRSTVTNGLSWLMRNQKPDGDLRGGGNMYSHGLATLALCEAYGPTGDPAFGYAAQAAIDFIQKAQNQRTGGWRYTPGDEGDTSVLGWQLEALQSGRLAGLKVKPESLEDAGKWLKSVASGEQGGKSAYTPGSGPTPTMTAVGLLSRQILGAKPEDPALIEGRQYLLANLPDRSGRNGYYWFFATQVLHHAGGPDADAWKRSVSQKLVASQCQDGCAAGSWDPQKPSADTWGTHGGRLMVTSLSVLTLQVETGKLLLFDRDAKK